MPLSAIAVDLHRLAGRDDVVVDEGPHVHLLLHPAAAARRRGGREQRIAGQRPVGAGGPRRVQRLDPVIARRRCRASSRASTAPGGAPDLEDGGLAGREVDAAVVGAPDGHDRVPGPALAEQVPVLPVERSRRTGARRHRPAATATSDDARPTAAPGNEPAPIAQRRRSRSATARRAAPAPPSRSCSGPAGSWRASRSRRRRSPRRGTAGCRR